MEKSQRHYNNDICVVPGSLELFRNMRIDWSGWPVRSQAERETAFCRAHMTAALLINGIPVAMATVEFFEDVAWIGFIPSRYTKEYTKSLVKAWPAMLSCIQERSPETVKTLQSAVYPINDTHRRFIQFFGFKYTGRAGLGQIELCEMDMYERGLY